MLGYIFTTDGRSFTITDGETVTTTDGEITEAWDVLKSVIERVEFRIESPQKKSCWAVNIGNLLPEKWVGRTVPTPHHRYIFFRAKRRNLVNMGKYYVWGTMELGRERAECCLYESAIIPKRERYVQILSGEPTCARDWTIGELFTAAWDGSYSLRTNTCIDYAIRCWNLLSHRHKKIKWDDVCTTPILQSIDLYLREMIASCVII